MRTQQPLIIQELLTFLKGLEQPNPFTCYPEAAPTGSRVICDPPVMTTDEDWIVWMPEQLGTTANQWLREREATYSEDQVSYPDGVVYWVGTLNLIIVYDRDMYIRWLIATYWAKKLNIQSKEVRKQFFNDLVDQRFVPEEVVL